MAKTNLQTKQRIPAACCRAPPPDPEGTTMQSATESYPPGLGEVSSSCRCPLPVPGSPRYTRKRPVQVPRRTLLAPISHFTPAHSVSELRWEFDWYLKHPLRQAQTPPPSQHHSKLCPYFRSPLSPERLQRVSTQQSPPCPIPSDARGKWWRSAKESACQYRRFGFDP